MATVTIEPMALTVGDHELCRFTVEDAIRMYEAGIIGKRVELLNGYLVNKPAANPPHVETVMRLDRWLSPGFAAGRYDRYVQTDLLLPDRYSLPQPDITVVEVGSGSMTEHPHDALLIVEVSDSTLRTDLGIKEPLYAASGAPEYWVVDVNGREVHVFTEPAPGGYRKRETVGPPSILSPGHVDVEPLDLAALFAG